MNRSGKQKLVTSLLAVLFISALPVYADMQENIIAAWEYQDKVNYVRDNEKVSYRVAAGNVIAYAGVDEDGELAARLSSLSGVGDNDPQVKQLYYDACEERRSVLIAPYADRMRKFVFVRHGTLSMKMSSDTERVGDRLGGGLMCLATLDGTRVSIDTLLSDPSGCIRDPELSFDGAKILFSWKKDEADDDFHIYEMNIADRQVRQLTADDGFADIEPIYLPDGNICFNSTRAGVSVPCVNGARPVTNLYLMNKDGKYIRRVGFDQVHTSCPTLMRDGRVVFTRWEYNDRTHIYIRSLFVMNPDGTKQEEYFGNNSWWPTAIYHPHNIPGTDKVIGILAGHHSSQAGAAAVINPALGLNNPEGVTLVAPLCTDRKRCNFNRPEDGWDRDDDITNYRHPYSLDEQAFLASAMIKHRDDYYNRKYFALYFVHVNGRKEVLVEWDAVDLASPVVLAPREKPGVLASKVDYRKKDGMLSVVDVYKGQSIKGVERGTIKRLRVIEVQYRRGSGGDCPSEGGKWREGKSTGPDGFVPYGPLAEGPGRYSCPKSAVAWKGGTWDPKRILGEVPVYDDGSAAFYVPARLPVYFQLIDDKGQMVQTMRTWATLMPGEEFSCVGCHEDRTQSTPPPASPPKAMIEGAQPLESFYGLETEGFSFEKQIQPILDQHCVKCHDQTHTRGLDLQSTRTYGLGGTDKYWLTSYMNLVKPWGKYVKWITNESSAELIDPYSWGGSAMSMLVDHLRNGHKDVTLNREEMDKICAWIDLSVPQGGTFWEHMKDDRAEKWKESVKFATRYDQVDSANVARMIEETYGTVAELSDPKPFSSIFGRNGVSTVLLHMPHGVSVRLSGVRASARYLNIYTVSGRFLTKVGIENRRAVLTGDKKFMGAGILVAGDGAGNAFRLPIPK